MVKERERERRGEAEHDGAMSRGVWTPRVEASERREPESATIPYRLSLSHSMVINMGPIYRWRCADGP